MLKIEYNGLKFEVDNVAKAKTLWGKLLASLELEQPTTAIATATKPTGYFKNGRPKKATLLANKQHIYRTKKRFVMGARIWSKDDYDRLIARYKELLAQNLTRRRICLQIGQELSRTPAAISIKLDNYRKGKIFLPKYSARNGNGNGQPVATATI